MEIVIKKSIDFSKNEWIEYSNSFNEVFGKNFTVEYFKHKYFNTIEGYSYHALLKSNNTIVGGFAVIPFEYIVKDYKIKVAFPLDVFILSNYRSDFLNFYKMYREVKKELEINNFDLVIVTPNDESYSYWKKMMKMKDIGNIPFHIIPVRPSKISRYVPKLIDRISKVIIQLLIYINNILKCKEKELSINIIKSEIVEKQRYYKIHKQITIDNNYFSYRIIDEDNVNTCYVIDFYDKNTSRKTNQSLSQTVRYIIKNEKIDVILFIGEINIFQTIFLRVPARFEPRKLHFMGEIINKDKKFNEDVLFNYKNWDFGLFNFDVR